MKPSEETAKARAPVRLVGPGTDTPGDGHARGRYVPNRQDRDRYVNFRPFQTSTSGHTFQADTPVAKGLVGARFAARACPMDLYRALIPVACLPVGPSATVKDTF